MKSKFSTYVILSLLGLITVILYIILLFENIKDAIPGQDQFWAFLYSCYTIIFLATIALLFLLMAIMTKITPSAKKIYCFGIFLKVAMCLVIVPYSVISIIVAIVIKFS